MMRKAIKIKLAGMILSVSLAGVPGCATAGFVNPFEYLTQIVSVDSTNLFVELYTALLNIGMAATDMAETESNM
ncbi:MAG: hypothetical protein GX629_12310 [Phycisphaerae bacterium]|jgi:hypothetical protein|nr:hypothetical protein [Phycisphaerae bacterium]